MENIAGSSQITYFLMEERTEKQILERLGDLGVNTAKNLKIFGVVKTRTEGTETFYELNPLTKFSVLTSPTYWHHVLREKLRTL